MTENQSVIDRLKLFIKSKNLGQTKFEEICGLGRGWVSKIKGAPKDDKLLNIIQCFPDLNTVWLLTGEGEMLRIDATSTATDGMSEEELKGRITALEKLLDERDAEIAELKKGHEERLNTLQENINSLAVALAKVVGKEEKKE